MPTRVGFRVALRRAGFTVVAEADDVDEVIAAAEIDDIDLALVDVGLPGDGIAALARLAMLRPALRLVAVTERPSDEQLLAAVMAGAAGYLSKQMSADRLPDALRGVLAGEVALRRRHSQRLLDELRLRAGRRSAVTARVTAPLTDREWEVLDLLADGCSTAEMARRLRISDVTVRRHVSALVAKLGVRDRAGVAALVSGRSSA